MHSENNVTMANVPQNPRTFFTLRLSVILLHLRGVQQRLSGVQQRTTAFFS